jgi:hypothetical protein
MHLIEELLETVFSMWPNPGLYNEDQQDKLVRCGHEELTQSPAGKERRREQRSIYC